MTAEADILELHRWLELLVLLLIGFLLGLLTNIPGGVRYFTVALAQANYQLPEIRVPLLPRCLFVGLLLALVEGVDPNAGFNRSHPVFVAMLVASEISVALWLYQAYSFLISVATQRKKEIAEFIDNPAADVPAPDPGSRMMPATLRWWSHLNTSIFLLLLVRTAVPVLVWRHQAS